MVRHGRMPSNAGTCGSVDVSRLTDLLAQAKAADAQMGADLEREVHAIPEKTRFGLQFERHRPEAVELPQRRVRKGDKVRILPARGRRQRVIRRCGWSSAS